MRLSVSGLPNKVLSGETFHISIAIDSTSGSYFSLGERSFSLDAILSILQNRIEKIDLRPLEELVLHGVQSIGSAAVLYATKSVFEAKLASELIGRVGKFVIDNTELWIMNQLEVEAIASGPAAVSNNVLRTWFGKSATMVLQVGQVVQRGITLAVSFVSRWVMRFHFDLKQSLYSHQLIGGIMRKIRDALQLPWEPELGTAKGGSTPSLSSKILLPDFTIQPLSYVQTVTQGESAKFPIRVASLDEFDSSVRLNVQGLPVGATGFIRPDEVTPDAESVVTIETGLVGPGSYTLIVTGEGGGKTHQSSLQLVVNARPEIRTTDVRTRTSIWTGGQPQGWIAERTPIILLMVALSAVLLIGLTHAILRKRTTTMSADHSADPSRCRPAKAAWSSRVRPTHPSAATEGTVFCRFCGVQIHPDAAYCPTCGRKQPTIA